MTGIEVTAALRAGERTAREVLEAQLDVVEARNPELNAITQLDADAAFSAADELDRRLSAGEDVGPLAGWPVTIKDSFDVRGFTTTVGRRSDARQPAEDAPAVARLRAAGAIILGKTNVPPMLDDYQSSNADFGVTRNPRDPTRTPGGSSGGSGAAVGGGLSLADLGSDLYGSIRLPAAWCGVFAHRPSHGVISKRGHLPAPAGQRLEPTLSTAGPLAGSADDLLALFEVLAIDHVRSRLAEPRSLALAGLRVAFWSGSAPVDSETSAALTTFADRLSDAGCVVTELPAPFATEPALALIATLGAIELAHDLAPGEYPQLDAPAVWAAWEEQARLDEQWSAQFGQLDVVIAPTTYSAAPMLSDLPTDERFVGGQPAMDFYTTWSRLTNVPKGPATVIPLGPGRETGLPIGAQLMGPAFGDLTTLRLAALLTREGLLAA